MSVFDFFGKSTSKTSERSENIQQALDGINLNEQNKPPMAVFSPTSFDDVAVIIDTLKTGETALVHLNGVRAETSIRVIDFLSGAVYALGGGVYEMEKNIFMFSPNGVEKRF